jgi:hypothetical protein
MTIQLINTTSIKVAGGNAVGRKLAGVLKTKVTVINPLGATHSKGNTLPLFDNRKTTQRDTKIIKMIAAANIQA